MLATVAVVTAALGLGLPVGDSLLRGGVRAAPAPDLVSALRLSGPALHPAGTPARQPETVPPGADLHADPTLVRFPLDDAGLVLPPPRGGR